MQHAFAHLRRDVGVCLCTVVYSRKSLRAKCPRAWGPSPGRCSQGSVGQVLTLGLARSRGLLGAGVLDEYVVLVIGAALLAHLHHLHLGQRRVPLHHILGPQGHQAADLQLAPARKRGHGPGDPVAPSPRASQSRSSAGQLSQASHSPSTSPQAKTKPGGAGNGGRGRSIRASRPQPHIQNHTPTPSLGAPTCGWQA